MASVQELLLAAEAKKRASPLIDLLNTGIKGYQTGQDIKEKRVDIATKLVALQQQQEQQRQQEQLRKEFQEKVNVNAEKDLRSRQAATGAQPGATTPAGKFEEEWTQDAKGNVSRTFKQVSPPAPKAEEIPPGYRKTAAGNLEFIPGGPEDPAVKSKLNKPVIDRSMMAAIAKSRVELADTRPMVDLVTSEIDRVQKLNADSYGGLTGALKMKAISAANAGKDNTTYKNTADIVNTMQAQVVKVLKSTFGGQLSDGERQYLNQVYGALPSMSQTERDIAMTNVKTMLSGRLKGAQSKLDELTQSAGIDDTTDIPKDKTPPPSGNKIRVKRLSDGQTGTINESDFDAAKYERVN